jgi:acyl-CoA synthetase (AMP-forming)/AMP-acid ligase II
MKPYPGLVGFFFCFVFHSEADILFLMQFYTGDGAARDEDGYIWIKGRIDGGWSFLFGFCGGGGSSKTRS